MGGRTRGKSMQRRPSDPYLEGTDDGCLAERRGQLSLERLARGQLAILWDRIASVAHRWIGTAPAHRCRSYSRERALKGFSGSLTAHILGERSSCGVDRER